MDRSTVAVYEQRATEWRARRPPGLRDRAGSLVARMADGVVVADLGCGAGLHLPWLSRPAVALDAAWSMVALVRDTAPDAWPVQGDLEALPFRRGSLGGAWARASYLHLARTRLPTALAELHHALVVGAPISLTMHLGSDEGTLADDEFPGRFFAGWQPDDLDDVLVGAGFTAIECTPDPKDTFWLHVEATRARTLADTAGPAMRLLVCGLNPSIYAADAGVGFARPGNRFWPAALDAGIVSRSHDAQHALRAHAIGMTDLVKRATARAAEIATSEYREGVARVERLVRWLAPGAVCFVGLAGWRAAVDPRARAGVQPTPFGGRPAYVMPSTSGLNARTRFDELVAHLRAAAALADRI